MLLISDVTRVFPMMLRDLWGSPFKRQSYAQTLVVLVS
jgi:hypothetical protein